MDGASLDDKVIAWAFHDGTRGAGAPLPEPKSPGRPAVLEWGAGARRRVDAAAVGATHPAGAGPGTRQLLPRVRVRARAAGRPVVTTEPLIGALHPWSTDFEWRRRGASNSRRLTSRAASSQFDRTAGGWSSRIVVDNQATVAELTAELDDDRGAEASGVRSAPQPDASASRSPRRARSRSRTTRWCARSDAAATPAQRIAAEVVADLCHDLLGPDVRLYWDQLVYKTSCRSHGSSRGTRTTATSYVEPAAVPHDLAGADRRHRRQRLPVGGTWQRTPARHARPPLRASRSGCPCFDDHPDATAAPVRAGGAVVFSSLTPHRTGPNTTDSTRKTYILQYAPDGAEVLHGDPAVGPPTDRATQDDPARQYEVLRNGAPIGVAE